MKRLIGQFLCSLGFHREKRSTLLERDFGDGWGETFIKINCARPDCWFVRVEKARRFR